MEHYFSEHQKSPFRLQKIHFNLNGIDFEFNTAAGVFSYKRIDKGTELLIKKAIIKPNWSILDLGCGYGCIGIIIGKLFPDCNIIMIDINRRACKLAKMNITANEVNNVEIRQGDLFSAIHEKFNTILVNPPQTAGKKLCYKIIEKSYNYLEKGGLLQLVARHNTGGKELEKKMKEVFGNVRDIAKKGGYRVYLSKKLKS